MFNNSLFGIFPRKFKFTFRELAKLGVNDFILGSGTLLEVNAFKPGQIETFYASQQIGEHPLAKNLNLEGELFLADLSYIAALN